MKWEDLNTEQREVITATGSRVTLVFGGAGSGKTTVALWCARHFLLSELAEAWHRVLFLTFSRTAVRELSRRTGQALVEIRGKLEIHTFHAFATRILAGFARYAGLEKDLPPFRSDAEAKVVADGARFLSYDDLLPLALKVIRTPRVKNLLSARWPLVICDEFHDTDDLQWELLSELTQNGGRLVLLADPNQMIYASFLGHRGVGPRRVELAREVADLVVDLGTPSYRDPTNIIPAMAEAIRNRDFGSEAITAAVDNDRLKVVSCGDDELLDGLRGEVEKAWSEGFRSIGILGRTNRYVAELSAELLTAGIDHVLVGLPEAHGEALTTLETACLYGAGRAEVSDVRLRLAVFLTACVRGANVPPLALAFRGTTALPEGLKNRLETALTNLREVGTIGLEPLIRNVQTLWPRLGITVGNRPWGQAVRTYGAIAQQVLSRSRGDDWFFSELRRRILLQRTASFFDLGDYVGHSIQLMNFHQTKGREADVVILVFRDEDYFGTESEPFPTNSRLLYVSLTRARQRNIVLLPEDPHPLVAPLAAFCY